MILSALSSTPCDKFFSFLFIEKSILHQKNFIEKNLFVCKFGEVQQGREL
jgi:hypothetical protein